MKKFLAFILALTLCVSMLSTFAFAADDSEGGEGINLDELFGEGDIDLSSLFGETEGEDTEGSDIDLSSIFSALLGSFGSSEDGEEGEDAEGSDIDLTSIFATLLGSFGSSEDGEEGDSSEMTAEFTKAISLLSVLTSDDSEENLAGGWTINSDIAETPLDDDAKETFENALEGFVGVGYKPVATIATQVVAGLNYLYLATGTVVTANPVTNLYIVKVYRDLSGNAEVTASYKIDLGKLIQILEILAD